MTELRRTLNYTLQYPIEIDGAKLTHIILRRPTMGVMRRVMSIENAQERFLEMLIACANVDEAAINEIDLVDAQELLDQASLFLTAGMRESTESTQS